jgi:hypothetical protein
MMEQVRIPVGLSAFRRSHPINPPKNIAKDVRASTEICAQIVNITLTVLILGILHGTPDTLPLVTDCLN